MPGDTGDMVIAAASLREAHPPGYPLYAMIGKLFVALPIGDIPYRANLMDAFLGGLSVALVFLTLLLLTRRPLASLAGALLFAFNYLFWTYFTLAETFCLNNFTLALTAFLALLWRAPPPGARRGSLPASPGPPRLRRRGLDSGSHTMVLTYLACSSFVAVDPGVCARPAGLAGRVVCLQMAAVLPTCLSRRWCSRPPLGGLEHALGCCGFSSAPSVAPSSWRLVTASRSRHPSRQPVTSGRWPHASGLGLCAASSAWPLWKHRTALLHSGGGFLFGVLFVLTANIDPAHRV